MGLSFITEWQLPRCGPWVAFSWTAVTERLKGSCNLIVEVSHKHACRHRTKRRARAHLHARAHKHTHTEKTFTEAAAHSKPRTFTRAPRTHSISLSGKQLTRIDCLIFAGVCSSVKAPLSHTHTHTSPYSSVSTVRHISETDPPNIRLLSSRCTLN